MNAVMWMGVAGIVGTAVSPWITERLRSRNARRDQLVKLRLAIYADLLRMTARLAATATTSAASHPNDAGQIGGDGFDSLLGQAQVVASDDVYRRLNELSQLTETFNRHLVTAEQRPVFPHRQHLHDGALNDPLRLQHRRTLTDIAGGIAVAHGRVQDAIRHEMNR
ncbi:hypothetical protein C8E05_7169 [Rhodococcus wratislaviensis]|uniref:Uncharacterized protein n=3 Tax=Rhodococcus TaxID=1827 RepID=A0AB38F6G3_RHOWR|nr:MULTISPECIES: hypothetical protein [Rhodococcus]AII03341.1 hypothetical protein EP51_01235 [Rhodococcus opacus]REE77630.1 hypothetical protein C8E05_7169 [Rhodococcus wratislaviensis]WAM14669.1 hypothetical protein OYT95_35620 [Rhodococcus sp. JS3073]SPZ35138.1 Uncharacterised protein [Rhodococcus wratislaviensis]GAF42922.1 hypothetical protein RW1_005_00260 [Rhodococcus wratislaviensis NBRC 100605]